MLWEDFYDGYCDWSESTVRTRISSLADIGEGEDVVDVILNLSDEKSKIQLAKKAMKLGVRFTQDDFMTLDGELPDDLYAEVGKYGGFYVDNPYFDENDFDWDDFFAECASLPEDMALRCISRIIHFGDSDDVVEAILSLSPPADEALYNRAIERGVRFNQEQLELMGRADIFFTDELNELCKLNAEVFDNFAEQIKIADRKVDRDRERIRNSKKSQNAPAKAVGLGTLIGVFKGILSDIESTGGSKRR